MFYSKNKRLYDLILTRLNANTQGVVFSGNYMFKFSEQTVGSYNFEIISRSADSLEFTSTEYVPLVDVQSIQVPFVETNKRDDWEREFYVAIKMPSTRNSVTNKTEYYFDESNLQYQAILETLETLSDTLTFEDNGYKYTFKVKEPTKVNVMTYNGVYYQILAMTFNLTSMEKGFFGNETMGYLGLASDTSFGETSDYLLDKMEITEIVGKTTRMVDNINDTDVSKQVDKRTWEANITVNFNGNTADMLIYKEKSLFADIDTLYQLKITNKNLNTLAEENLDYTINVYITNVNITYRNNVVDQLTFKVERA
jgi:hypothetical protein